MSDITVIVPYYNEERSITQTLDRLQLQTLPAGEVIMVNSSSTDTSSRLVDEWIIQNGPKSKTVYRNFDARTTTPGGSKAAGVDASTTSFIAFMDCGLNFADDWLEQQHSLLSSDPAVSWVSGVCITHGDSLVDKCAIAQTYGYGRGRPVVPSSLLKRDVFDVVGPFRNLRAGYDVEWVNSAKSHGLKRLINPKVEVSYEGTNFAPTLWQVFSKSALYARASVQRQRFFTPYIYAVALLSALLVSLTIPRLTTFFLVGYFVARLLLAAYKSRAHFPYFARPDRMVVLLVTSAVMDAGKFVGYLVGFGDKLRSFARALR